MMLRMLSVFIKWVATTSAVTASSRPICCCTPIEAIDCCQLLRDVEQFAAGAYSP